jgi:hypothetical protein
MNYSIHTKNPPRQPSGGVCWLFALLAAFASPALAQTDSQTIQLQAGWNAVPLRVAPETEMGQIFAGTPVEMVTTWYPEKQKVASLQDLAAEPWKGTEWRTWQRSGRAGAFLNNLHALESGRSYLIKSASAATVTLSGKIEPTRLAWQPQSFNLTGLPADPAAPATLAAFFADSAAHRPLKAFRLVAGKWQAVPAASAIDPTIAYWIWCGEGSEFQGPLDVRVKGRAALNDGGATLSMDVLSPSAATLNVQITAQGTLPLSADLRQEAPVLLSSGGSFAIGGGSNAQCRLSWAAGAAPTAGAQSLVTLRAAGVRLTVPVLFDASAP